MASGIRLRAISQKNTSAINQKDILIISDVKFRSNLPGTNELMHTRKSFTWTIR